jgi:hypothetical protein
VVESAARFDASMNRTGCVGRAAGCVLIYVSNATPRMQFNGEHVIKQNSTRLLFVGALVMTPLHFKLIAMHVILVAGSLGLALAIWVSLRAKSDSGALDRHSSYRVMKSASTGLICGVAFMHVLPDANARFLLGCLGSLLLCVIGFSSVLLCVSVCPRCPHFRGALRLHCWASI